jgi:xylulokinase
MLEYLGIDPEQVCDPVDSDTVVGDVTGRARTQLGLPGGVMVVAGAGDRQCEALGAGVSSSTAMESTGSATNLSISASSLPGDLSEGLLYSCHAVKGQYLLEQGIGSTGLALRWFRDTFRPPDCESKFSENPYRVIDREASRSVPGSNGLTFLPFLMGAQATRWNPGATGVFLGIRLGHGYGDMARAVLEGIAFEIRAAIGVLVQENLDPGTIMALGGSAGSGTWNRIKADATGRIYSKPRVTSAASLGAMILGANGCGLESPPQGSLNPVESRFVPDPETRDAYDRAYRTYERLYSACEDVFRG